MGVFRTSRGVVGVEAGFTLVELLLTVVLLLSLLGALVFEFGTFQRGAQLDEGATQMEALFRYARAHAASTGRQVRVEFSNPSVEVAPVVAGPVRDEAKPVRITWESNPIEAPGVFTELPGASTFLDSIADTVHVREVRLAGASGPAVEGPSEAAPNGSVGALAGESSAGAGVALAERVPVDGGATGVASVAQGEVRATPSSPVHEASLDKPFRDPMLPIRFYPDGSGDSAQVVLASRDEEDVRRLAVQVEGVTGMIQRRPMPDPGVQEPAPSALAKAAETAPLPGGK